SNPPNATLRAFFDSTLVGTMRYLAGYDGCTDSNYVEYNPKATHLKAGACATPVFIQVGKAGDPAGRMRLDDFRIAFTQPGVHSVDIYSARGAKVASHRGHGTREYRFSGIREPGVYYVRILTDGMKAPYNRRIVLLETPPAPSRPTPAGIHLHPPASGTACGVPPASAFHIRSQDG